MLHRRTGFALATAAILPATALAQTATQSQGSRSASDGMAAGRMQAGIASHFALITARLGAERTSNADVRRFAQLEVAEQEATMVAMEMAGVSVPREYSLPADKQRIMEQLQNQRGEAFDTAFLAGQKTGHEELLMLHTRMMQSAETPSERIISTMAVPGIRSHLAMIEMLRARS